MGPGDEDVSHAELESNSIYLIRDGITDRLEQRRLQRVRAEGLRGPDDLTGSGKELFCPGGLFQKRADGLLIMWELRLWNPVLNSDPDSVQRIDGWKHLIDAGFHVADKDELSAKLGWTF